jgi:hypothetical protein
MRQPRNIPRNILRVLLPVVIVAFIPGLTSAQDRGDVNADRREEQAFRSPLVRFLPGLPVIPMTR